MLKLKANIDQDQRYNLQRIVRDVLLVATLPANL